MAYQPAERMTLMVNALKCKSESIPTSKFSGMMRIRGSVPRVRISPLRPLDSELSSSLGHLDRLPPELMLMIMQQLDPKSLSRLSRVSYQGHGFVMSCLEYQDLLMFLPTTFEALRRLHILDLHPVVDLCRVFRTVRCDFCAERGPFLFLPTAQRCCMGCLKHQPALRLMTISQAKKWYGLTKKQIDESLRVVHVSAHNVSHDGMHHRLAAVPFHNFYPNHGKGLIANQARDLAIAVHGSAQAAWNKSMANVSRGGFVNKSDAWEVAYWHGGHLRTPYYDVFTIAGVEWDYYWSRPHDNYSEKYSLMAAMPFETLRVEDGRRSLGPAAVWCRACDTSRAGFEFYRGFEDNEVRDDGHLQCVRKCIPKCLRNDTFSAHRTLFRLADTAWSPEDFMQHAKFCPGAIRIMRQNKDNIFDGIDLPNAEES